MGLRLEQITHGFNGIAVVRDVGLSVRPGQVACLLGPSGCGKTTLLRLAAGLELVQRGRVAIGGRFVADGASGLHVPPERRRAGLMFQDYALFPHLTVLGNVTFGVGDRSSPRIAWARSALERLGLAAHAGAYPHTLSGGEQQRCALLRALAPEPDVLLLDEPFSGMDVTLRAQVREETLAILRETGVSTLIVTHDPEEAMYMGDRLWIMNAGTLVQSGPPEEIYLHPRDAFVAGLFGPLNRVEGTVRHGRLATPFGPLSAPAVADGTTAICLIRPEAVIVREAGPGLSATVVSARLLGRASHLRLALSGLTEPVQALVPGVFRPAPGEPVTVEIDPAHTFVFPAPTANAATA